MNEDIGSVNDVTLPTVIIVVALAIILKLCWRFFVTPRAFTRYTLDITHTKWAGSVTYRGESRLAALNLLQAYNDHGSTYLLVVDTNVGSSENFTDPELIKKILLGEEQV